MEYAEIGRLERLPSDNEDALAVYKVARVVAGLKNGVSKAGRSRVVREALFYIWEQPRFPKPLVAGKYPVSYPWSAQARQRIASHGGKRPPGGWGLVLEHMFPRRFVVDTLLRSATTDVDFGRAVDLLHGWTRAAIITREEDKLITASGYASTLRLLAKETDLWQRYEIAGIDTATFGPLAFGE